jgi:hypothetical protein
MPSFACYNPALWQTSTALSDSSRTSGTTWIRPLRHWNRLRATHRYAGQRAVRDGADFRLRAVGELQRLNALDGEGRGLGGKRRQRPDVIRHGRWPSCELLQRSGGRRSEQVKRSNEAPDVDTFPRVQRNRIMLSVGSLKQAPRSLFVCSARRTS